MIALASIPSREVLLSQILNIISSPKERIGRGLSGNSEKGSKVKKINNYKFN